TLHTPIVICGLLQQGNAFLFVAHKPGAQRGAIIFARIVLQHLNLKPFLFHVLPVLTPKFVSFSAIEGFHKSILSRIEVEKSEGCQIKTNAPRFGAFLPLLSKLAGDGEPIPKLLRTSNLSMTSSRIFR